MFYSLPMLGTTIFEKLHHLGRLGEGDQAQALKALGVQSMEALHAAARVTQVDQLLGLFALPQLQRSFDYARCAASDLDSYEQQASDDPLALCVCCKACLQ